MQRTLIFKTLIVLALTLLIAIPLALIQSTISERNHYRAEAVRSIATDSVGEQTVIGPLLVIPYTDEWEEEVAIPPKTRKVKRNGEWEEEDVPNSPKTKKVRHNDNKQLIVFPNELHIKGNIENDHRYRGIHKVLVYSGQHQLNGDFSLPNRADFKPEKPDSKITMVQPFVALTVGDVRGIRNIPNLSWNGKQVDFQRGSKLAVFENGLHAPLEPLDLNQSTIIPFSFNLQLDGIENLHFSPVAKNNQVTLKSNWPHPHFDGRFLPAPKMRVVNEQGFSATWNISSLATNAQQQLAKLAQADASAKNIAPDYFGVGFIEPVNVYSQADRAVKYGLLFVALTFAAFFLFELLKQLPVHPVQYLLVGLALALFFLLLVSLSEHLSFLTAYLLASGACIALIGFYLRYVLRDWKRGFGFGVALTLLYGALYGLLSSENNALVLGSILLFISLSAIMIATRKVDWYQIGKSTSSNS